MDVFSPLSLRVIALDVRKEGTPDPLVRIETPVRLADKGGNRSCICTLIFPNSNHSMIVGSTPEELATLLRQDINAISKLVKVIGLQPE